MTDDEIRGVVWKLAVELAPVPRPGEFQDLRLTEDLGYHSLALVELAFALEERFDLPPIDQASARNIHTTKDVADYVISQVTSRESKYIAAAG